MKHKVVVEYEYPVDHKTPVKAELILHGDSVETWDVKPLEQEPKWIPVTERLPEENGGYLVTVKRGYVTTALWVGNAKNWEEVTAWMPLPQPYKAESEGVE